MKSFTYSIGLSEMVKLSYLTKENLEDIHSKTLQLLQDSGVSVMNIEAGELLENAGCTLSGDIVKIPESLVNLGHLKCAPILRGG